MLKFRQVANKAAPIDFVEAALVTSLQNRLGQNILQCRPEERTARAGGLQARSRETEAECDEPFILERMAQS